MKEKREVVRIGGRSFNLALATIARFQEVSGRMIECGMGEVEIRKGEAPEEFARRLVSSLALSRKGLYVVSAMLIPVEISDEEWTEEIGEETARFIGGLSDPEDVKRYNGILAATCAGFFGSGLASLFVSPTPSSEIGPDSLEEAGTSGRGEDGPTSSERSQDTITSAPGG